MPDPLHPTTMASMSEERRQLPPWLTGLILALVLFVVVLVVLNLLGYGDDPALGS